MNVYLGGTFDPIHNGHIQLANELLNKLSLDNVFFMPCYKAVHKDKVQASASQRLAMLKLAIEHYPSLAVDAREMQKESASYTYDSLLSIRKECVEESICFVMGMDSLINFSGWYQASRIHELANLIIVERPASSFNTTEELVSLERESAIKALIKLGFSFVEDHNELKKCRSGKAHIIKLRLYDISSTRIRSLVRNQKETTHLVSKEVAEYIQMHNLYQI